MGWLYAIGECQTLNHWLSSLIYHDIWLLNVLSFSKQNLFLGEIADMHSYNLDGTIHNKWLQQSSNIGNCLYAATVDEMDACLHENNSLY